MQTTSVFLPGKSHGQRSLAVYSPWGRKKSDMTERLHFHFHSAYKLNKQGDNIHPWCTPFPILNQPALSKTIWTIFPTAFSYFMSLSHFGDSGKISDFFIMIILLQWFVIRWQATVPGVAPTCQLLAGTTWIDGKERWAPETRVQVGATSSQKLHTYLCFSSPPNIYWAPVMPRYCFRSWGFNNGTEHKNIPVFTDLICT